MRLLIFIGAVIFLRLGQFCPGFLLASSHFLLKKKEGKENANNE